MQHKVVCFGEILWDVFPTHKVIGGAPLNVALRLESFGVKMSMISRLGNDENGTKALDYLKSTKLNIDHIQKDITYPTGYVSVFLDEKKSATYEIFKPVAWDFITNSKANEKLVLESDVFIFGSLACRSELSKETLLQLVDSSKFSVFDANLRKPDYTIGLVMELMRKANFIKLNDDELHELAQEFNGGELSMKEQMLWISEATQTHFICVTRGSQGAILFVKGVFFENQGYEVMVEDTVGAGDSFLAALILKLFLEGKEPEESLDFACRVGALVASKKGANAKLTNSEIESMPK